MQKAARRTTLAFPYVQSNGNESFAGPTVVQQKNNSVLNVKKPLAFPSLLPGGINFRVPLPPFQRRLANIKY